MLCGIQFFFVIDLKLLRVNDVQLVCRFLDDVAFQSTNNDKREYFLINIGNAFCIGNERFPELF